MPKISIFYGIIILMRFLDHNPPHFHVEYSGHQATIDIEKLCLLKGFLPKRALNLVLEWAELHQKELRTNWDLCIHHKNPIQIDPLD